MYVCTLIRIISFAIVKHKWRKPTTKYFNKYNYYALKHVSCPKITRKMALPNISTQLNNNYVHGNVWDGKKYINTECIHGLCTTPFPLLTFHINIDNANVSLRIWIIRHPNTIKNIPCYVPFLSNRFEAFSFMNCQKYNILEVTKVYFV